LLRHRVHIVLLSATPYYQITNSTSNLCSSYVFDLMELLMRDYELPQISELPDPN
jgi:hypothetical protein